MGYPAVIAALLFLSSLAAASQISHVSFQPRAGYSNGSYPITPKVFIISMFSDEGVAWYGIPEFDILAQNITVPGISPLFPQVHCTADGQVCQVTTGEGEINAAVTVNSIAHSPLFDLHQTYFLIAGIAGVSPKVTTIGAVTFARFAVAVALQYEIDAREKPTNWTTGYFPQGGSSPTDGLVEIYGTEVFEVNDDLKQVAMTFARNATLNDTADAIAYRALYGENPIYALGAQPPSVVACDTASSDVYFTGELLANAFENTTSRWTNGSAVYCSTQQEDNATLEALLRAATTNLVDFSRIIIMRTASDFDRPHVNQTILDNLLVESQGYEPSILNIYLAGVKVVEGILNGWDSTFAAGVKASNYVGDVLGTLGEQPDFLPSATSRKRRMKQRRSLKYYL
ncbi:hypothetical protein ACMFMG_000137 [Clarireedia jacksonii]